MLVKPIRGNFHNVFTLAVCAIAIVSCMFLIACDDLDMQDSKAKSEETEAASSSSASQNESAETAPVVEIPNYDISTLGVSGFETHEMDGSSMYEVLSNVGASDRNLAAFKEDCITSVGYVFQIPLDEATTYVDRVFSGESPVVVHTKYEAYTLRFEVDSAWNKEGAYSFIMSPDTTGEYR